MEKSLFPSTYKHRTWVFEGTASWDAQLIQARHKFWELVWMVPDRMRCALKAVWGFHVGFTFRSLPLFLISYLQEKERTNLRGGGFPPKIYIPSSAYRSTSPSISCSSWTSSSFTGSNAWITNNMKISGHK